MDIKEIETQVVTMVADIVLAPVDSDSLLIESGLVDSLSAVDVALAVESRFGCKIPPPEIDLHLASVQSLATYIAEHRTR